MVTLVIRCVPDKVWTACTFLGVVHGLLLARQTHRDARESGWGPLHTFPTKAIHFTRNLFLCSGPCCPAGPFIHGGRVVAIGKVIVVVVAYILAYEVVYYKLLLLLHGARGWLQLAKQLTKKGD